MTKLQQETKSLKFEVKNFNEDDEYFTFEGYASTFGNVDLGDDVIVRGAFVKSLKKAPSVPVLDQHEMGQKIGDSINLHEDERGLYIKAILPKSDSLVTGRIIPQMKSTVKAGRNPEMSIGFFVIDYELKGDIRELKEIDLFEVSLVTKGMNPKAQVSNFKSVSPNANLPIASRTRQWDSTDAVARIRSFTKSTEKPTADYKKYFMYFDGENADRFGSYKMPFTDIVDGEPHIIPRAVFAVAGALEGARGGTSIPETDQVKIKTVVNGLYKKMADKFDDDSLVSPFTKCFDSFKDIEKTLKDCGFSNNEAKTLISKVKELSNQRDAEEENKNQCDADTQIKERVLSDLQNLYNDIKQNKIQNV